MASPGRPPPACIACTDVQRPLFPAMNVNDSVTKSKFDNLYGCRESLVDGIKRATDVMIAGKIALVCGYGDVGKGSAQSLRGLGANVKDHRDRPDLCTAGGDGRLPRGHDGRRSARSQTSSSPPPATRTSSAMTHMAAMKDQAIVCNIGHFDNEIQASAKKHQWINIKPQVDQIVFPDGQRIILLAEGRLVNLGCHRASQFRDLNFPSPTRCWRRSSYSPRRTSTRSAYILPKKLDEEVARLHLGKIGAKLTTLSQDQADYIGVPVEGPYLRPIITATDPS